MNFEVIKRSHVKRNILIAVTVVLILSAVILTFTRAKYRVTQSVPLVSGAINFSPYDFNVVAMYLNKGDETVSTTKAPHVGYTLNENQSTCIVDDAEVENGNILFENGNLTFQNMNYSGTKCSVYFDLIPDSENPVINNIESSTTETSITIKVNASDNIGIYYYYFKLDNGEEIQSENASHTFENLNEGQTYMVTVRVEDAAGNTQENNKSVTAGLYADGFIENLYKEGSTILAYDKTSDNNLRYIGVNPNNYVYFNCDDYSNPNSSTCELWRIIGIFNENTHGMSDTRLVKIIRDESIGEIKWSSILTNNWNNSSIKSLLNTDYLNGSGNYTTIGIKNQDTREMIATIKWKLGGSNFDTLSNFYINERGTTVPSGNPTEWSGQIGLMYLSDFGYAVGGMVRETCINAENWGSNSECHDNNWLFDTNYQSVITPSLENSHYVFSTCGVMGICQGSPDNEQEVKPTIYLVQNTSISGGDGTQSNPYTLSN